MARRILVAPDKFKTALSAAEAARAIAAGIRRQMPDAEIDLCPIADGGEGFMEAAASALQGKWIDCPSVDALGRDIDSRYFLAETPEGPTAIIEMAETAGLWRIAGHERDPHRATTRGTGIQLAHAVRESGATRVFLGIGGSATNDGGCGLATALGARFLDAGGNPVDPVPAKLPTVSRIDLDSMLELPPITVACDVTNPLLGPRGAAAVYGPQKGATEEDIPVLEAALAHLVQLTGSENGALEPGAGAAGGLGFGLLHFANATLAPGFDLLADLMRLEDRIRAADLVITGEGSIDAQSFDGKGPVELVRLAARHGIPTGAICGLADPAARDCEELAFLIVIADNGLPVEALISRASELLEDAAAHAPINR